MCRNKRLSKTADGREIEMTRYYPNEEERLMFERYLDQNGIEDEWEIQEAWRDFCDEIEHVKFKRVKEL